MRSAFYQLMIIAVYVLAAWDLVRVTSPRHAATAAGTIPDWRRTMQIAAGWLAFQIVAMTVLLFTGNWERANTAVTFYVTNALALFVILPAGLYWQSHNGMPAFPLLIKGPSRTPIQKRTFVLLAAITLIPLVLSSILLLLIPWRADASQTKRLEPSLHGQASNLLFGTFLLMSAAVAEEAIWRHYFLGRLVAFLRRWICPPSAARIAAVVTSLIFVCGHASMLEPAWLKDVQILIYGISLAVCQVKLGTECAVLVHFIYNVAGIVLAGMIVQ